MELALINNQPKYINEVKRGTKGVCAICGGDVIAKIGQVKQYFAHVKGVGSSDCNLYLGGYIKRTLQVEEEEIETRVTKGDYEDFYNNIHNNIEIEKGFTDEQLAVINSTEPRVMVNSTFGSGKSSTVAEYIRQHPDEEILYITFNKTACEEFKEKVYECNNVDVRTIHGYAYKYFGDKYRSKLTNNLNVYDIGRAINKFLKTTDDYAYAEVLLEHFKRFLLSEYMNVKTYCVNNKAKKYVGDMKKLYNMSKSGKMKVTHNFYLKLFHQSNHEFDMFDTLIIDEVQDISSVVFDIIKNNESLSKIIIIGDVNQSIYQFMYCVNAFELLDEAEWTKYELNNSFRIGNTLSEIMNTAFSIEGVGVNNSQKVVKEVDRGGKYYELCRYNATIIRGILHNALLGKNVFLDKGKAGVSFKSIRRLYEFKTFNKQYLEFKKFENYYHLVSYAEKINDYELKLAIKVIDEYGDDLPKRLDDAEKCIVDDISKADIVYCTGHSSKGKTIELPLVVSDDFPILEELDEDKFDIVSERNLLLVACSRAKGDFELPTQLVAEYERQLES